MNAEMQDRLTVDKFYSEAGQGGRLLGLICDEHHVTVPPRSTCRVCKSTNLKAKELSGQATVISYTEVYMKAADFPVKTPYTLVLVRLDEGGQLLGILDSGEVSIGTRVRVNFRLLSNTTQWPRIFFDPIK